MWYGRGGAHAMLALPPPLPVTAYSRPSIALVLLDALCRAAVGRCLRAVDQVVPRSGEHRAPLSSDVFAV